jgi:hypothetical protein
VGPRSLQSDIGGFPISDSVRYRLSQIFVLSARLWKRRPVPQSLLRIFENCYSILSLLLSCAFLLLPGTSHLQSGSCTVGRAISTLVKFRDGCFARRRTKQPVGGGFFFQLWSASRISRPQHDSALLTVHIQLLVGPLLALVVK